MKKNIWKTLIRIVLVSIYAILVMKLVVFVMPNDDIRFNSPIPKQVFVFFYLLFFNLNTEGSLFFDRYLNKKIPWFYFSKKRIFIQFTLIILWAFISIGIPFIAWYFINGRSFIYPRAPVIVFIGSVVLLLVFIGISMTMNFFKQWQISLLDAEHYKQEKLKAEYKVLQNQVNPHFLFNSLNVLISEIKYAPDVAVKFTRKLSKVYRYVLQSKNHDLISLQKELDFIDSFIFLHKVRIGDALHYSRTITEDSLNKQLPPLTLQILIENAIKHNIASIEHVLNISIETNDKGILIVKNNLQLIENADSTNTGLSNLSKRFELLDRGELKIQKTQTEFIVTVPLIEE